MLVADAFREAGRRRLDVDAVQHPVEQQSVGFGARLEAQARALRAAVLQRTGIPVSIGIAPTKTLAKVAHRFAKKDPERVGVLLLLAETAQDAGSE